MLVVGPPHMMINISNYLETLALQPAAGKLYHLRIKASPLDNHLGCGEGEGWNTVRLFNVCDMVQAHLTNLNYCTQANFRRSSQKSRTEIGKQRTNFRTALFITFLTL